DCSLEAEPTHASVLADSAVTPRMHMWSGFESPHPNPLPEGEGMAQWSTVPSRLNRPTLRCWQTRPSLPGCIRGPDSSPRTLTGSDRESGGRGRRLDLGG